MTFWKYCWCIFVSINVKTHVICYAFCLRLWDHLVQQRPEQERWRLEEWVIPRTQPTGDVSWYQFLLMCSSGQIWQPQFWGTNRWTEYVEQGPRFQKTLRGIFSQCSRISLNATSQEPQEKWPFQFYVWRKKNPNPVGKSPGGCTGVAEGFESGTRDLPNFRSLGPALWKWTY